MQVWVRLCQATHIVQMHESKRLALHDAFPGWQLNAETQQSVHEQERPCLAARVSANVTL
jgi:hypothetical protein